MDGRQDGSPNKRTPGAAATSDGSLASLQKDGSRVPASQADDSTDHRVERLEDDAGDEKP